MAKAIGPTFYDEIKAAGISGNGWACRVDGTFSFNALPQATQDAILAVYAAHDPTAQPDPDKVAGSRFDGMEKTMKAALLLMRSYSNALQAGTQTQKTIAQLKADYIAAFKAIP